jgi:hypothetical protein
MSSFNPNKTIVLTPEEELLWSKVVGQFILNFGNIEWVIFRWIKHLDPSKSDNKIFKTPLAEKVKWMPDLIASSKIPEVERQGAIDSWNEVAKLSTEVRNPVSHNPLMKPLSGPDAWGILDTKNAVGSGPIQVRFIVIDTILDASARITHLAHKLELILAKSYPGNISLQGA